MTRASAIVLALLALLGPSPRAWAAPPPGQPSDPDAIIAIEPAPLPVGAIEGPRPPALEPAVDVAPAPSEVPAPVLPQQQIRVAVGLSPEVLGDKQEKALLDRLEQSARASSEPATEVRRLRAGSAEARVLCREGRDDLIVTIGYLPERSEPVVFAFDCRIDEELGVRAAAAVDEPELIGVLWAEHHDRVAAGARERRRNLISPKVKTGLIAGAAVLVIGAAAALLIIGATSRDTVVLTVSPIDP
jgi:hypothetical protein